MYEVAADFFGFLSIQAQDFIEDLKPLYAAVAGNSFLSIQAQDFIEDDTYALDADFVVDS